jgi:hypothetical protein
MERKMKMILKIDITTEELRDILTGLDAMMQADAEEASYLAKTGGDVTLSMNLEERIERFGRLYDKLSDRMRY